jgi:predicted transposase/invertase (TIGR01784 family)
MYEKYAYGSLLESAQQNSTTGTPNQYEKYSIYTGQRVEKSRAKGIAEGIALEKINLVRKLLARNHLTLEEIIEDTGLAIEEIESLRPHCAIDESERS